MYICIVFMFSFSIKYVLKKNVCFEKSGSSCQLLISDKIFFSKYRRGYHSSAYSTNCCLNFSCTVPSDLRNEVNAFLSPKKPLKNLCSSVRYDACWTFFAPILFIWPHSFSSHLGVINHEKIFIKYIKKTYFFLLFTIIK